MHTENPLKILTEEDLRNAGVAILLLNIPATSAARLKNNQDDEVVFNSKDVQACIEDSWRTSPEKLKRAKLILASVKDRNAKVYTRKILGVFEYADARYDKFIKGETTKRSHFEGVQPAPDEWSNKFKGMRIVGLNPKATNPLRYFLALSSSQRKQNIQNK